jgi:hypothetical protein
VTKLDLVNDVLASRAELLEALGGLSDDALMRPGVEGVWSIKDVLGHLIAWEAELVTTLNRRLSPRYKDAPDMVKIEDIDEWNAEQYHLNARKPVSVILADFHGVHKHLVSAIDKLDAKLLDDPLHFEWMEGEPLAYLVLETAVWHEREHAERIREWRAENSL